MLSSCSSQAWEVELELPRAAWLSCLVLFLVWLILAWRMRMLIGLGFGYGCLSSKGCTSLSFKILEIRRQKGRQFLEVVHSTVFTKMWKIWEHTSISSSVIRSCKEVPILGGKPFRDFGFKERWLVNSPFNQQQSVFKVSLIVLKYNISSEFLKVINSYWWSSSLWPWRKVININHRLFSFILASFHGWGLEWRHLHT